MRKSKFCSITFVRVHPKMLQNWFGLDSTRTVGGVAIWNFHRVSGGGGDGRNRNIVKFVKLAKMYIIQYTITLWAQILLIFALRCTVSEILPILGFSNMGKLNISKIHKKFQNAKIKILFNNFCEGPPQDVAELIWFGFDKSSDLKLFPL